MEKKIEDYLHLYLGCTLKSDTGTVKLMSVIAEIPPCTNWGIAVLNGNQTYSTELGNYKPILRPLSDITEEEAIEVFKMCSLFDLSECVFEFGENYETWINAEKDGRVIDAIKFVGDNIEMMNNKDGFSAINPISGVTKYYLSKHFDLFGLIDAGLAIDKTKL